MRIEKLQEEVARLQERIAADAARRRFRKQLASLRRELGKPSPRELAMAEIEKTAYVFVRRAEAWEKRNRGDEARQEYEHVVKEFPKTSWAKEAQARLDKKTSRKGEK